MDGVLFGVEVSYRKIVGPFRTGPEHGALESIPLMLVAGRGVSVKSSLCDYAVTKAFSQLPVNASLLASG
eukprot:scaffold183914_cov12-Tisochrysis_lutea.AAC.1